MLKSIEIASKIRILPPIKLGWLDTLKTFTFQNGFYIWLIVQVDRLFLLLLDIFFNEMVEN